MREGRKKERNMGYSGEKNSRPNLQIKDVLRHIFTAKSAKGEIFLSHSFSPFYFTFISPLSCPPRAASLYNVVLKMIYSWPWLTSITFILLITPVGTAHNTYNEVLQVYFNHEYVNTCESLFIII